VGYIRQQRRRTQNGNACSGGDGLKEMPSRDLFHRPTPSFNNGTTFRRGVWLFKRQNSQPPQTHAHRVSFDRVVAGFERDVNRISLEKNDL
jgi:hypothetical protein